MSRIEKPLAFAKEAKSDAQAARKKNRFDEAEDIMTEAVEDLESNMRDLHDEARSGERAKEIARALSDSYGTLGGIRRSAGRYEKSADAYDEGEKIESDRAFGIVDSYNLTQRLVARVLIDPLCLVQEHMTIKKADFPDALSAAERKVTDQIEGPRINDPWAQADRALILLLLGRESEEQDAWAHLRNMKPPAFVFGSTLNVVRDLRRRIVEVAETAPSGSRLRGYADRLAAVTRLLEEAEKQPPG